MVYSIAGGERLQTPAGPVITVCSSRQNGDGTSGVGMADGQKKKLDLSSRWRCGVLGGGRLGRVERGRDRWGTGFGAFRYVLVCRWFGGEAEAMKRVI